MSRKDLALPVQRQAIADRIRKAEQMCEMGAYAYPSCRPWSRECVRCYGPRTDWPRGHSVRKNLTQPLYPEDVDMSPIFN